MQMKRLVEMAKQLVPKKAKIKSQISADRYLNFSSISPNPVSIVIYT